MSDLEQMAKERLQVASEMSLRLYKQPLVITYSGGKDSDVLPGQEVLEGFEE